MEFTPAGLGGAWLVKPKVFRDDRGCFLESYVQKVFAAQGIDDVFVQDNQSTSLGSGVLRGLHYQAPPFAQSKLVRVVAGAVFDVIVDLRGDSPTRGKWAGFELTAEGFEMLYVPRGFAHGFCTLCDNTVVLYKADNYYSPPHERGIAWNDPDLAVAWPVEHPLLSERDGRLPRLGGQQVPF
jgi:dTDP-4-dehydrorhamnose 3,5-epimerase